MMNSRGLLTLMGLIVSTVTGYPWPSTGKGFVRECKDRVTSDLESQLHMCEWYCEFLGINYWNFWCGPLLGYPDNADVEELLKCIESWNPTCYDRLSTTTSTTTTTTTNLAIGECVERVNANDIYYATMCKANCYLMSDHPCVKDKHNADDLVKCVVANNPIENHKNGCYDILTITDWVVERCAENIGGVVGQLDALCRSTCKDIEQWEKTCPEGFTDYEALVNCISNDVMPGVCVPQF